MHFFVEKITKRLEELSGTIYDGRIPVTRYRVKPGKEEGMEGLDVDDSGWDEFDTDNMWGGYAAYMWFRQKVEIPKQWKGKKVAFHQVTTTDEVWKTASEYSVFVDGALVQGLDIFHHELLLAEQAQGGESYQLAILGFSGYSDGLSHTQTSLVSINQTARDLYYDIKVAFEAYQQLDANSPEAVAVARIINETVNIIDFRRKGSEDYYASLEPAKQHIRSKLYEEMHSNMDVKITAVGHTHIDVAWLWRLEQTREKAGRSFSTVCRLMDQYPDYKFFQSQPQLYDYMKRKYPDLYEQIKNRIKEGRWEAEGGMWVEADCNLISGESMIRQFLIGKKFFRDELGVDSKVLWLPDVFGYSAAMPQILNKCKIDYFMTTKISWNQFNQLPMDTFYLQGIDGSTVLTHFITTPELRESFRYGTMIPYKKTYNGIMCPKAVAQSWQVYKQKESNQELLMAFGWGDGGGGPTQEMLENAQRLHSFPGLPKEEIGFVKEYFDRLKDTVEESGIPTWVGELYLEMHRGTYTSMARNKRFNRKCEFLYENVELFSMVDTALGAPYPQDSLNDNWKVILLNQFHDIIPGSSIKEVYEDSLKQYESVMDDGNRMLNNALDHITGSINADRKAVVVFNPNSNVDKGLVTFKASYEVQSVADESGNLSPVQKNETGSYLFYADNMASKGYQLYYPSEVEVKTESLVVTPDRIENKFFEIYLDSYGNFTSIYDKKADRQVLKEGQRGNVIQAFEDKPINFNAWDIDIYYTEKMWEVNDVVSVEVVEEGPVRGVLRIQKKFLKSLITQDIVVYNEIPRIDFETTVDWKEQEILLKAAFPVQVNASKATFEIQYGNLERNTHKNTSWDEAKFEVCAHKWVDVSEYDYGVSLLNDCKYGHDVSGTDMRITLLKSGIYPNPDADKEVHHFVYSLYPHEKGWREAGTVAMAYELNNPMIARCLDCQDGILPSSLSTIRVSDPHVVVETVKKAEADDAWIIRLYECYNSSKPVTLTLFRPIAYAVECDMLEEDDVEIPFEGNQIKLEVKPFEIKTLKVRIKL